jgi:hypothetical protein
MLKRGHRPDLCRAPGGIGFGQQPFHRHLGKGRVAKEGIAIVERQFQRFGHSVEIDFAVGLHSCNARRLQNVERHQQRRPRLQKPALQTV